MSSVTLNSLLVYSGDDRPLMRYDINELGIITRITNEAPAIRLDCNEQESVVTPGLVDIQINGFNGLDFNSYGVTADKLDNALAAMLACGVTRCLPTLISAEENKLYRLLQELDDAVNQSALGKEMVVGYHIEGPFLSPKEGFVGAHPKNAMISGSAAVVKKMQSISTKPIKLMTVAPEIEGVIELISFLKSEGISVALGHTDASPETISEAVKAGAILSTHLGNGLAHQLHKVDNPLMAQLAHDGLYASFIADGLHVKPEMLKTWIRAKSLSRSVLTTDATAAAGLSQQPGRYWLGEAEIELCPDGVVRIPGSPYFAGSSARMDKMLRDTMKWCGLTMSELIQVTRHNPLHLLSFPNTMPKVGDRAEFLEWSLTPDGPYLKRAYLGERMLCPSRLTEFKIDA
ncbi:amidohydrolase family protein [Vibrio sp. S9_S30]|uniref:N-acetylglucosamine-6-phosphate deacetylase n=1 Tax=Vibrio sp. S9_S30 TaxID=2720226 RepID=UPI0016818006|nr:amidohydrolase family protein [Vibrio sp. S9_S30]MBD1556620.1 amidohydrolase family protein [Vibrio sp. S9_S30]